MWKVKIINIEKAPAWINQNYKQGDIIEMNEEAYKYNKKIGVVEGIEHFRYVPEYKKCKCCGNTHKHRKKIPYVKQKRPRIIEEDWY